MVDGTRDTVRSVVQNMRNNDFNTFHNQNLRISETKEFPIFVYLLVIFNKIRRRWKFYLR